MCGDHSRRRAAGAAEPGGRAVVTRGPWRGRNAKLPEIGVAKPGPGVYYRDVEPVLEGDASRKRATALPRTGRGAVVARQAHNREVGRSNRTAATQRHGPSS